MERDKALDMAIGQIEKAYGKGSIMRMGEKTSMGIDIVPTGAMALDLALGIGGLPRGRVVEIYGPESSGKSTLAMHVVAEAQRNGGICAYIDAEHAMDPIYASAIGVNVDELLISQPDTGEQALEIADMLIRSGALDVLVIDSVAALTPRAEIEGEMGDTHVGLQARLMSQALRKITANLNKSNTICIFINQLREKIGVMFGSPETTPGGRALKFYSSVRLDIRRIESIKDGVEVVGNRTRVKVVKNKCVAAGTTVFDPTTGLTHRIEDIVEREVASSVVAADKLGVLHVRPITQRFDQGEAETIGLHFRDGTELWVTPDHKVMTQRGWVEAGQLTTTDRVARPRQLLGFGEIEPVPADHARLLGSRADADLIPAPFFAPDVSEEVVANLVSGVFECDGWVRDRSGAVQVGFTTTSDQRAQQLHWLLLRWGITNSVKGRRVQSKLPCWEVRVSGMDNVARFAEAIPMWGPRGQALTAALADPALRTHRGSQQTYLSASVTEPVLAYLRGRGVTPAMAAAMVGEGAGDPRGGLKQVLGVRRLRRDRVARLASSLDSTFLAEVLADGVWYDRVTAISPAEWRRIYDIEVAEDHTFVANDLVISNCSPPFKQAEFDIMYGKGISREGSLLDIAVDMGIAKKSGAWYTYEGEQLGQGRENAKGFLHDNPELMVELNERIRAKVGLGVVDEDVPLGAPGDDEPLVLSD